MNAGNRSDLPEVKLHLGLATVVDKDAARQSLNVDTAADQAFFVQNRKRAFLIRFATKLEHCAFLLPAQTVVVVAFLSPELYSRTFIPPRNHENAAVARQLAHAAAPRKSRLEWLGDLLPPRLSPQLV